MAMGKRPAAPRSIDPIFEDVFQKVYGLPGWRVSPGWGSFLTFEFGTPHLEIREPITPKGNISEKVRRDLARRAVRINGEWHLWINCCNWKVFAKRKLIGESTSRRSYQTAADFLDGQKLTRVSIHPQDVRSVFEFDLGGRLETRPYDAGSEQWMFFDRSRRKVLTLRADGRYSYHDSNRPRGEETWKPVQVPVSSTTENGYLSMS